MKFILYNALICNYLRFIFYFLLIHPNICTDTRVFEVFFFNVLNDMYQQEDMMWFF